VLLDRFGLFVGGRCSRRFGRLRQRGRDDGLVLRADARLVDGERFLERDHLPIAAGLLEHREHAERKWVGVVFEPDDRHGRPRELTIGGRLRADLTGGGLAHVRIVALLEQLLDLGLAVRDLARSWTDHDGIAALRELVAPQRLRVEPSGELVGGALRDRRHAGRHDRILLEALVHRLHRRRARDGRGADLPDVVGVRQHGSQCHRGTRDIDDIEGPRRATTRRGHDRQLAGVQARLLLLIDDRLERDQGIRTRRVRIGFARAVDHHRLGEQRHQPVGVGVRDRAVDLLEQALRIFLCGAFIDRFLLRLLGRDFPTTATGR